MYCANAFSGVHMLFGFSSTSAHRDHVNAVLECLQMFDSFHVLINCFLCVCDHLTGFRQRQWCACGVLQSIGSSVCSSSLKSSVWSYPVKGLRMFNAYMDMYSYYSLLSFQLAAIGPSTAAALHVAGIHSLHVARNPSPEDLLSVIRHL